VNGLLDVGGERGAELVLEACSLAEDGGDGL
jgi:hypothetical protein